MTETAGGNSIGGAPGAEGAASRPVKGSRVGIVGGSIAGCALAIALSRLGCAVTVLERSSTGLRDRGSGIAIPKPLRDELIDDGYLPSDYPTWLASSRGWHLADGTDSGTQIWAQPGTATMNNWGSLWRGLRDNLPDDVEYLDGCQVLSVDDLAVDRGAAGGVVVGLGDGTSMDFDVVFGADGYRSLVRSTVQPDTAPNFAGYVLWRGNFPAEELTDRAAWDEVCATGQWVTVAFDGGHAVMYPIPDFDAAEHGGLRVNWAIYAPKPDALALTGPSSIPPGQVDDACYSEFVALLDAAMPPKFRPLFDTPQEQVSIQPVYDEAVDQYTSGRLAVIGDAATLSRPHTGSGATKAMEDARLIEALGADHQDWPSLLAAYDEDRSEVGKRLVALGRRIGRAQVERTPPWAKMTHSDFEAWASGTLGDDELYFWSADDEAAPATA